MVALRKVDEYLAGVHEKKTKNAYRRGIELLFEALKTTEEDYRTAKIKLYEELRVKRKDDYMMDAMADFKTSFKHDINRYIVWFLEWNEKYPDDTYKSSTIRIYLQGVFNWWSDGGINIEDKTWLKSINKKIGKSGTGANDDIPSDRQLRKIFNEFDHRAKAFFGMLGSSGMRPEEPLQFDESQIELDHKIEFDDDDLELDMLADEYGIDIEKYKKAGYIKIHVIWLDAEETKSKRRRYTFMSAEEGEWYKTYIIKKSDYDYAYLKRAKWNKHEKHGQDVRFIEQLTKDQMKHLTPEQKKQLGIDKPFGNMKNQANPIWNGGLERAGLVEKSDGRYLFHPYVLKKRFKTRFKALGLGWLGSALVGHEDGYLDEHYTRYSMKGLAILYKEKEKWLNILTDSKGADVYKEELDRTFKIVEKKEEKDDLRFATLENKITQMQKMIDDQNKAITQFLSMNSGQVRDYAEGVKSIEASEEEEQKAYEQEQLEKLTKSENRRKSLSKFDAKKIEIREAKDD